MPTLIKATKQEYIAWVQRSLNRLPLGDTALITDGKDTSEYRDRVRAYKADKKLGKSDEVDAKVQNALIDGSHKAPEYVTWVQIALEKAVTHSGRAPTGKMDSATKTAIKSFQTYEGLGDDGWIGPDTETVLIERSGVFPPGHFGPIEAPPEEEAPAEQERDSDLRPGARRGPVFPPEGCHLLGGGVRHDVRMETRQEGYPQNSR